nr:MAG TPA: hypothetical protein [Caudoviricetes sp.]
MQTMGIVGYKQWASFEKRMCRHIKTKVLALFAKSVSTFYQKC